MKRATGKFLAALLLSGWVLAGASVHAAQADTMDQALEQTEQLQALAEEYASGKSESDPLMMTVNYIRARRYDDVTWNMILGEPDNGFAAFVEQQMPELGQLQTLQNVQTAGESVDFVHLVIGIGATYKRMPVVCTWGGDCIQLAGSLQGSGMDEEECIRQLEPYFACEEEYASLFPKSDWLADLDAVNIGSELARGDDLADRVREYYGNVDDEERAERFICNQFGQADTGDQQTFRQQVKDKFFADSGVQLLLLSQEQLTLDDQREFVVVDSMNGPLNAVCSLTADTLAEMLNYAQVPVSTEQPESQDRAVEQPGDVQSAAPTLGQSSLARTMEENAWLPWGLGGVVIVSLVVLVGLGHRHR